jgi:hypothetical protein
MGPPLTVAVDVKKRQKELREEFGKEAQRDWWDPGEDGRGGGRPAGIRKLVNTLEDAAAERKMFHPRFAGGENALLRMFDRVTYKWLNQCIHHTTVGLPFTPTVKGEAEISPDPMMIVAWHAAWLFTQQVYLAHDATNMAPVTQLEVTWWGCMIRFSEAFGRTEATERLEEELMEMLGVDLADGADQGWIYGRRIALADAVNWQWFRFKQFIFRRDPRRRKASSLRRCNRESRGQGGESKRAEDRPSCRRARDKSLVDLGPGDVEPGSPTPARLQLGTKVSQDRHHAGIHAPEDRGGLVRRRRVQGHDSTRRGSEHRVPRIHPMSEVVTMIGASHSAEEAAEVEQVMRRLGLAGPVELSIRGQGEGIAVIVIQAAVPIFLEPFLRPVADGAAERFKRFFWELHEGTRWGREARIRQIYVRPDAVTSEEWERSGRRGRLPGWRHEDPQQPELVMTSLMPDEAWEALAELDPDLLEAGGSYWWSDEERRWRRAGE